MPEARGVKKGEKQMLTKPVNGWSHFQLENTSVYELSYLDDLSIGAYIIKLSGKNNDISENMEEWISFIDYRDIDAAERTEVLTEKLAHLKGLLSEREEWFGADRCFL